MTACTDCVSGKFSNGLECEHCPMGSFSETNGLSTCASCPVGTFQSSVGSTFCQECTALGQYAAGGATSCINCGLGTYSSTPTASACTLCPVGTFINTPGMTACSNCSLGTFAATEGSTVCLECAAGSFGEDDMLSTCVQCPPGSSASAGQSACSDCVPGKYAVGGMPQCADCPFGTFSGAPGLSTCLTCASQYYAFPGATACLLCPVGDVVPPGCTASSPDSDCAPGTYWTGDTTLFQDDCDSCPPGTFTPLQGMESCLACDSGKFQPDSGKSYCLSCAPGTFSLPQGTHCAPCTPGSYAPTLGLSTCFQCPVGKFSDDSGSAACAPCAGGSYAPTPGISTCLQCPTNTYSLTAATECVACDAPFISTDPPSAACVPCPAGQEVPEGADACEDCGEGKFSVGGECHGCPPGSFAFGSGVSACTTCPPGTVAPSQGLTACSECAAGQYAQLGGATTCVTCASGSFSGTDGLSTCTLCPPNSYAEPGADKCTECPEGQSSLAGAGECLPCAGSGCVEASANPSLAGEGMFGYGTIVVGTNPPVVGNDTVISVTVTNAGVNTATDVELLLFVNDWGITFGGWNEIGSQTVTELPAGESVTVAFTHIFPNRARTSLLARIADVGSGGNTDTSDDVAQMSLRVASAEAVSVQTVPLICKRERRPCILGKFRAGCLVRGEPGACPGGDLVLSVPAKTSNGSVAVGDFPEVTIVRFDGRLRYTDQSRRSGEEDEEDEEVEVVVMATDLETGASSHAITRLVPASPEELLDRPNLCCIKSVRTRVTLELLLAAVWDAQESASQALKQLEKFIEVAQQVECDLAPEEKDCLEKAMVAAVEVGRMLALRAVAGTSELAPASTSALKKGDSVSLVGFGSFSTSNRAARRTGGLIAQVHCVASSSSRSSDDTCVEQQGSCAADKSSESLLNGDALYNSGQYGAAIEEYRKATRLTFTRAPNEKKRNLGPDFI